MPATKKLIQLEFEKFLGDGSVRVVNSDGTPVSQAPDYNVKITESGNYTYVAIAPLGTAQASAAWKAMRIDETTGTIILWAGGGAFNQVATDLTALTYV